MLPTRTTSWVRFAVGLWVTVVATGFALWARYDTTPGPAVTSTDALVPTADGRWTITMFLHPRCPCSAASLHELNRLVADSPIPLTVRVLFVRPEGAVEGWERTKLWDAAIILPDVKVATDPGGSEARRMGAMTSGHLALSDPTGRIRFRGGITVARGRIGDSDGRRAILSAISQENLFDATAPTFGCALFRVDQCSSEPGAKCLP